MEANATYSLFQTIQQGFGLGRYTCQKHYVCVPNSLYWVLSASGLFCVKAFSFIWSIDVRNMYSRQIINIYGASVSPNRIPATMSKKSVSPSCERTFTLMFFQAAVVSIVLYGCTTWTLTKRLKKKLDGNYTRMLRAILNTSWRQHPTKHQLYGHLLPITKTIQVRRTRHAGHCWRSKDERISDVFLWTPAYGRAKAGRPAWTNSSYVRIRDVALKTC